MNQENELQLQLLLPFWCSLLKELSTEFLQAEDKNIRLDRVSTKKSIGKCINLYKNAQSGSEFRRIFRLFVGYVG